MPAAPPTAPPRNRRKALTKQDISEPYDFVHCAHVGLDFNSEDVKHAIRPVSAGGERQSSSHSDHVYEAVNRQLETPILMAGTNQGEEMSPPMDNAPEYISIKDTSFKMVPPAPPVDDIVDYVNRPTPHYYGNITNDNYCSKPRPSKKKNPPPPPPPQADKPKLDRVEETVVVLRAATREQTSEIPEEMVRIDTPRRVEPAPVSVVVERPGLLGEMRLGLDDPIPLQLGIDSSKYRSPSMLTPKEVPVDVPTPLQSPGTQAVRKEEQSHRNSKAPLTKEAAVDVPPTPAATSDVVKMSLPEVATPSMDQKRPAPTPPEPLEPPARPQKPYVPPSVANNSPQLKNVISELKSKHSKDGIPEEEADGPETTENEYVSVSGTRKSPKESHKTPVEVILESKMEQVVSQKEEAHTKTVEPAPAPVPKPRKTVAHSTDTKTEEGAEETRTDETTTDDGIDTGCSDEDTEVIRL